MTATVSLRSLRPSDDDALLALFGDPDVARWNPGPSASDVPRWRAENAEIADDFRTWAIADASGAFLGVVSLFSIEDERHTAEVGFRVAPAARGRGVGRVALEQALERGAAERDVRIVDAWHAVANPASCAVLTACGFALAEVVPDSYEYGDGVRHDEHHHRRELS